MMEVLKKVKRKLSVVLAAAMVVTSITIPNATVVKAADLDRVKSYADIFESIAEKEIDAEGRIVLAHGSQTTVDARVKSLAKDISVNGVEVVSANDTQTAKISLDFDLERTDEQEAKISVVVKTEEDKWEGIDGLDNPLPVIIQAKPAKVTSVSVNSFTDNSVKATAEISDYVKESTEVKYAVVEAADAEKFAADIASNFEKMTDAGSVEDGKVSIDYSGSLEAKTEYVVIAATKRGEKAPVYSAVQSNHFMYEGKPIKEPSIKVNFQSVDGTEVKEGTVVSFNDIDVVVNAENVPEGEKVILDVFIPVSGGANVVLASKELVVSGNMVDATERIQIPEDALGKQIRATARIRDTKYYSITDVWVRQKPILEVTKGIEPVNIINGSCSVVYGTDYTIKLWDPYYKIKDYAKFTIEAEDKDKADRITVSKNGTEASFKAKKEDAKESLYYVVKGIVDGKEVEYVICFRVKPDYTITINDISAKKGYYTVSDNKTVVGTHMAGDVINGGIVITANEKEGYVLSEVNVNGKKLNERLEKSFTITNTKEKNFVVDEDYVINVKTVASVANKAEITIKKNGSPIKSGATINCGDEIKIEAYKDGTKLDVSDNLVVKHKDGSKYVECTNSGLTIEGDGIGTIQNIVAGEQLQVVIQSKDGTIKYATYNFKVSKLAKKILVNKKATETITAEQANVKECQLTADGYINFSVANKEYLKEKHIIADVKDNKTLIIKVYPEAKADKYEITVSGNNASGSEIVDVTTAKVELTVKEPAWKDAEITLAPSTKYTSYETIGFVPTFVDKKFKDLKAGNNFLSEYTFKWYYEMYDGNVKIPLKKEYSEENDIKVEPKDIVLDSNKSYTIKAKLRLVKNEEKVREYEIESNKATEASIKTFADNKTEKIGFKKKSSAAYTKHAVELATLTYDKNTGRRLSDYYGVKLYDQNGDSVAITGKPNDIDDMYYNDNYGQMGAWLDDGSLVVYAPSGFAGQKFTAEVYVKAEEKGAKDADVLAKTTFTVKKSIEKISGDVYVFKKENKALKVSLKPFFNGGNKEYAPASKKVSYALVGVVPDGVTLKGNTITIAKDAKVYDNTKIYVKVTAEDVKDYENRKKTDHIFVNVKTSASNAVAVYVAEKKGNKYSIVNNLVAGQNYSVILTTKEATKDGICYQNDLVKATDFSCTRDKSIGSGTKKEYSYDYIPTVAKKNVKFTATAYDGVKKTTKVNVIPQTLDFDKLSIEFGGKVSTNKIEISTTSVDRHDLNVLLNGNYINPSVYGLTMKVSGLKYNKDFGGYVMTGKTASIKVKGKDVEGKNVDKTFTIENEQYAELKKAPKLKAKKNFTVVNAANKGNTAVSLNTVTIEPVSGYSTVSTNVADVRLVTTDKKTARDYYSKIEFVEFNPKDGSITLSLDGKEVPAGNVKLNVYYMDKDNKPLTKPATITIKVQKMKYSFKLSSGIKFAAGSTSVNLVPKYDKNNVAKVEYTGDGLGAQNAFIKGKGEYNLFATKYFSIDNAGKLTFSSNGTIDSVYKLVTDKDAKVNKNGVIKVKVTYKDGAVRYYTTNVTVSQPKPKN